MSGELLALLIVCVICMTISRIATRKVRYRDRSGLGEEDAETMQSINRGLQRMEDRIDALETLLMDRSEQRRSRERVE